jgi:hypothetical protein
VTRGFQAELEPPYSTASSMVLAPELIDLVTEAVAKPSTAVARAEIISEVVLRVVEAVAWRHEPNGDPLEEASLMRIVDAAAGHRRRMLAAAERRTTVGEAER